MESDGFSWWIERFRGQLALFDWVRIDHFRGLEAYWEIPASSETAMEGRWVKAPGEALLENLFEAIDGTGLPLVAEDLGIITPEVDALRKKFDIPGMLILQFAFDGGAGNPYLPQNHEENSVVYTGTHDNDTSLSWFEGLSEEQKEQVYRLLGHPSKSMPSALIDCAMASVARLSVIPMQDVLHLGGEDRMNTPGTTEGNWSWRFSWDQVGNEIVNELLGAISISGRLSRH
jgi:4-alpha-glucanotransferase